MARRTARHFYSLRAKHHEAAANKAKSAHDREGHREVAAGYHKLARGAKSATYKTKPKSKKSKRSKKKGKRS